MPDGVQLEMPKAAPLARHALAEHPLFPPAFQKLCNITWANVTKVVNALKATASPVLHWFYDPDWCADDRETKWECSPSRFRLPHPAPSVPPCTLMHLTGTKRILILGESTARHVVWALLLLLTRRYDAVRPGGYPADCEWTDQLYAAARNCRGELNQLNSTTCQGSVNLKFKSHGAPPRFPTLNDLINYDVVVWGWQGHPIYHNDYQKRYGVNNAQEIGNYLRGEKPHVDHRQGLCADPAYRELASKKIILLDVHPRIGWGLMRAEGECPDKLLRFHNELPAVWREACGVTHMASNWNATVGLVTTEGTSWSHIAQNQSSPGEPLTLSHWRTMTFDQGSHWGTALNVLKAWSVLVQLESLKSSKVGSQT